MTKKNILLSLLIFVVSFIFFLLIWLQVKDTYGNAITTIASNMVPFVKEVEFKELDKEKEKVKAVFIYRGEKWWEIAVEFKYNGIYAINTPLTFAIMGGLFLFIKRRRRAYIEAVLILFLSHVLYVFIAEVSDLSSVMVYEGFKKASGLNHPGLWKPLLIFIEGVVLWFSPFLIGAYLYLRFSDFENA